MHVDWLVGAHCRLYKNERHSAVSALKICLSRLQVQPGWTNTKTWKHMIGEEFLNFMKLLNLSVSCRGKWLGEIDCLHFDDVRPPKFCVCGIRWHYALHWVMAFQSIHPSPLSSVLFSLSQCHRHVSLTVPMSSAHGVNCSSTDVL